MSTWIMNGRREGIVKGGLGAILQIIIEKNMVLHHKNNYAYSKCDLVNGLLAIKNNMDRAFIFQKEFS